MKLKTLLAPTYVQMLSALGAWLDKAGEQFAHDHTAREALLRASLAPDMYPLSTQIRFACVQAHEGMYRLRGEAFPAAIETLLDEGRHAGAHPGTLAEARARIDETLARVEALAADGAEGEPAADGLDEAERPLAHALPNGMVFDLTAGQYARDWAIPQFYFHVMTAYAILRSQGVVLGKADYVAHMLPFLRAETAPAA
ncbi:DUF1993 domain-containing protein [Novosphingobium soli]|uniref:DUF1993 family protein n=1 Tax=Novosphingobium soli TaxID=574956 RepID=A0ABV6CRV1_9SPHN